MSENPEFIVVKVVRANQKDEDVVREEIIPVNDIKNAREWANKGKNGVPKELPMTQLILKTGIAEEGEDKKIIFVTKLLLQEDFKELSKKINAVTVSE